PGLRSECIAADLADEAAARSLVPQVVQRFGTLDAVVNSASLFQHDSFKSFGTDSLRAHMRTNTVAPVLLATALHEHVSGRSGDGVVVNLLDQKLWNSNPDFVSYTLSKAALESANTMLALALAPQVRVVGVAPGLTLTGLKFEANLGILDHERSSPQPIMVDAELNLGPQPLLPRDDDIKHVLDYRKVRRIIIEECTAEHVNLLESLIGKLAHRLMQ